MKSFAVLSALLWASPAFADDARPKPKTETAAQVAAADAGEADRPGESADRAGGDKAEKEAEAGKFSLLSRECKPEESHLETIPGAPPLDVDDPETPGCNAWEVNITTSGEFSKSTNWVAPLFDINYGVGDNIQLKFEIPYEVSKTEGVYSHGLGAAEFGIKWRFYDNESTGMVAGIYPQVEFAIPGTMAHSGDEGTGTISKLPLLVSRKIGETSKGDIMVTGNIGYNYSTRPGTESYLSGAFGVGLPLLSNVALLAEVSTEQALGNNMEGVREGYMKANVGLLGPVNDHLLWVAALGRTFDSTMMDDPNHTCVLFGIRVLAGGP